MLGPAAEVIVLRERTMEVQPMDGLIVLLAVLAVLVALAVGAGAYLMISGGDSQPPIPVTKSRLHDLVRRNPQRQGAFHGRVDLHRTRPLVGRPSTTGSTAKSSASSLELYRR